MINKKKKILIGGWVALCLIFTLIRYISLNKSSEYYITVYENHKEYFHRFANLKDSVFKDNIGCNMYTVFLSGKGVFSQFCSSFNIDSTAYFDDDFLQSNQNVEILKFMNSIDLTSINFSKNTVSFAFDHPGVYIYNAADGSAGDIKLDEGFYLYMSN